MTTKLRRLVLVASSALVLSGCETIYEPQASRFGDANRATLAAQVVDPDPQYDTLNPPTSGEHAGQAAERYRTDTVKKPVKQTSTQVSGGGGGGN